MALSIGRIGSEFTQAPSLSIGDRRLSRFRSSATPPTCVRVRDRLTLSNAGSRLKTRGDNPGGSGRARRGLPTRPLAFSGRVLRALRREPSHSTRSSHLITRDSLILWRRVAAPAAHLSPLHHIITRLGKSCENGLGIPRWPPQSHKVESEARRFNSSQMQRASELVGRKQRGWLIDISGARVRVAIPFRPPPELLIQLPWCRSFPTWRRPSRAGRSQATAARVRKAALAKCRDDGAGCAQPH